MKKRICAFLMTLVMILSMPIIALGCNSYPPDKPPPHSRSIGVCIPTDPLGDSGGYPSLLISQPQS